VFIGFLCVPVPPFITLRIGSSLSSDDIKEGDDVYFECAITANPQWRRLTWLHNVRYFNDVVVLQHFNALCPLCFGVCLLQGMPLGQNISSKIVRSNQSLVLQKVNRFAAGDYQCSALNSEGETVSNELALKIKCK
jgi:Immunoglobulin domain